MKARQKSRCQWGDGGCDDAMQFAIVYKRKSDDTHVVLCLTFGPGRRKKGRFCSLSMEDEKLMGWPRAGRYVIIIR